MKNFLHSFKTTIAGSVFGGGFAGQALYSWLNGGQLDTKQFVSGIGLMIVALLAKDADKAGVVTQEPK